MVAVARDLQIAPTIWCGLRSPTTVYHYDDPDRPERITSSVLVSPWTPEDNALLLGLARYEESLCPGCGVPKEHAWHAELEGWWEDGAAVVCHACTAAQPDPAGGAPRKPVVYRTRPRLEGAFDISTLPPLQLGLNTTSP